MVRTNWNQGWHFTKDSIAVSPDSSVQEQGSWSEVTLPHTWNGRDGQDGGNDYHRGTCYYVKNLKKPEEAGEKDIYLEFEGANSSADVYVNGKAAGHHDGGYSTWRVNITEFLKEENEIVVAVNNAPNDHVYPQMADFTFYGGLYRNVNLLSASHARFDLDYFGGTGLTATPKVEGKDAVVKACAYVSGTDGSEEILFSVWDGNEKVAEAQTTASNPEAELSVTDVHLWNGKKDPHLYTLKAELRAGDALQDERSVRFGCRTFAIDPERGFILNGEEYPLRGVSRHQDRPEIGNALTEKEHEEDIALILEMGATTIRLAHYQHAQYFYDLCDEKGLVLWAEIPYISKHMPGGRENTISQMKELIIQNYNHPSIVVWGLSNEITMNGEGDADLIENHRLLNDLAHELDATRLTTIAAISMCSIDAEYIQIPDVVSYNHYYGWYGGDTSMNGPFFDNFHAKYPNIPIGISEYGCEALNWHTSNPEQGDYTEEYQAYYHEELIKQLFIRKFIWATHVWNMFDFAADARAEGGEDGMNHKGLVTFDRKYKKDAFYAYKAWLSDEPFVHICGKRYVDRVEDVTKVTVYSNQPEVELFVNGESLGVQASLEHFFYFEVPNTGESRLLAKAGACTDESFIRKVDTFNEEYRMKETGDVLNWFEIDAPEGYFSINDKLGDILATMQGKLFMASFGAKVFGKMKKDGKDGAAGFEMGEGMMKMLSGFTVKRLLSMMGMMAEGGGLTKEDMLEINRQLNKIKKNS